MAVQTRLGWKAVRFWFADNAESLGIPVSIAGTILFIGAIGLALWLLMGPVGRIESAEGQVAGLGFRESEGEGSISVASVAVDNQRIQIDVANRYGCRIGDRILLKRRKTRWGAMYGVRLTPEPCWRPAPFSQQ